MQTEERYSVLRMGNIAPLKDGNTRVLIRTYEQKEPETVPKKQKKRSTDALTKAGYELFDLLRGLRLEIAREEAIPPYIVFSDKTLIDMCVKHPQEIAGMLEVSGVGEAKLEKYGQRFLDAIRSFRENNPDAVLSIVPEEEPDADGRSVPEAAGRKKKKGRQPKEAFYLREEDAGRFQYQELYYVTEIRNECNRICSAENVRKLTTSAITEYLIGQGYIEIGMEMNGFGSPEKKPTGAGREKGIVVIDKVSQQGAAYTLLRYPPAIQEEIVKHFTGGT